MTRQKLKAPVGMESLLQSLFHNLQQDPKMLLHRLQSQWEYIVGTELASKTTPARVMKGGILIVTSKDSSWMTELNFRKEEILSQIKNYLPELKIQKIRYAAES